VKRLLRRGSLGRRVFAALIAGELAFALVLGVTFGVFSALASAHQREVAIRQVSAAVAAGLMPMIADQQLDHVDAQLVSILALTDADDVIGIVVLDASGVVIASKGRRAAEGGRIPDASISPWASLLRERVVVEPVVIDGLTVATVLVTFEPPGVGAFAVPLIATAVVLVLVMAVSLPWTAWRLFTDLAQPLSELGNYASSIAKGEYDCAPEVIGGGEVLGLQGTLRDMAGQLKGRDDRLRRSYTELADAYESLRLATSEIEQLSLVKSNFVAVAAHEIRGPLATVRVYAELLEAGELGELESSAGEAVTAIVSATSRLTSIVSDLMDTALLERGLLPMTFGDVSLRGLVKGARRDNCMFGGSYHVNVSVVGDIPDILLYGDETRLRQVLDNLLSNAIKYSPPAGLVHLSVRTGPDSVTIEVADEGRGVPQESHREIFALFGRVDFGDSRDTAGLGLGLAISARITEAHGGSIHYRANESGKGSVFCLELPLDPLPEQLSATVVAVDRNDGRHDT